MCFFLPIKDKSCHIISMTMSIRDAVEQHIIKHGRAGKTQLCKAVNRHEKALDRWMKQGFPTAHIAFKLALACGIEEHEALRLAREEALPMAVIEP